MTVEEQEEHGSPSRPYLPRPASTGALASLLAIASPTSVTKTYAAAVDKASQLLPGPLATTLSTRRRGPLTETPPPIVVCTRPADPRSEDAYLTVPITTTLGELRECVRTDAGIQVASQRLFIEEEERSAPGGLVSALRSTAGQWTNRERLRDNLVEWINFLFVPEAVNREVRGRGLLNWLRENVLPNVQPPPSPRIAHATVMLQGGRRRHMELSSTATLARLRLAVERQTGLPLERQRIIIAEVPPHGALERLFWSTLRVVYLVCGLGANVIATWVKWICGVESPQKVRLRLQTGMGRSVDLDVRQDVTLAQLQHMVQLQHGDGLSVHTLVLGGGGPTANGRA